MGLTTHKGLASPAAPRVREGRAAWRGAGAGRSPLRPRCLGAHLGARCCRQWGPRSPERWALCPQDPTAPRGSPASRVRLGCWPLLARQGRPGHVPGRGCPSGGQGSRLLCRLSPHLPLNFPPNTSEEVLSAPAGQDTRVCGRSRVGAAVPGGCPGRKPHPGDPGSNNPAPAPLAAGRSPSGHDRLAASLRKSLGRPSPGTSRQAPGSRCWGPGVRLHGMGVP